MLQAFIGLGPPASPGDIAVPRDNTGRVDFFTPDGQYKFGTSPFDCATGNSIGTTYFTNDNGAQALMGCAVVMLCVRIRSKGGVGDRVWARFRWQARGTVALAGSKSASSGLWQCCCGIHGAHVMGSLDTPWC
jgi:hypothetical protein